MASSTKSPSAKISPSATKSSTNHWCASSLFGDAVLTPSLSGQDFGYPQATGTDELRPSIFDSVAPTRGTQSAKPDLLRKVHHTLTALPNQADSQAASTSVVGQRRNEVFVDIVEQLNVVFNATVRLPIVSFVHLLH